MPRGPRITSIVKRTIVEEALRDRQTNRRELSSKLRDIIARMEEAVPAEDVIVKLISWARNHAPDPLDNPWSMGLLVQYDIPAEAVNSVLNVWKLCMATQTPFSVREARWVAKLYTVITDTVHLQRWASYYALREQIYSTVTSDEQIDSADLDARLTMSIWERVTTEMTGILKPSALPLEHWALKPEGPSFTDNDDGKKAADSIELWILLKMSMETIGEASWREHLVYMRQLRDTFPSLTMLDFSEEAAWVYTYWLVYAMQGPKWVEQNPDQLISFMSRLRDWVSECPKHRLFRQEDAESLFLNEMKGLPDINYSDLISMPEQRPTELLREVGYD